MKNRDLVRGLLLAIPTLAVPALARAAAPAPTALEILQKSVSFQTSVGNHQTPAYAA